MNEHETAAQTDEVGNVIEFPLPLRKEGHMTLEEFRERFRRIKHGNRTREYALLLSEAYENGEGLTHKQMATETGWVQSYVSSLIRFGNFLRWVDIICPQITDNVLALNSNRFDQLWKDTAVCNYQSVKGSLPVKRFEAVLALVEQMETPEKRRQKHEELAKAILQSDLPRGRKITIDTILEALPDKYDQLTVESFLASIRNKPNHTLQTKHYPLTKWALYEVPKGENPLGKKNARIVNLDALQKALKPEIKRLMEMGKTHNMRISCEEIRKIAMSIEQKMKDFSVEQT